MIPRRRNRILKLIGLVCVLAATLGRAPSARAQMMGMSDLFSPPVTTQDVSVLIETVGAGPEQEAAIRDLFQGFMQKHEQATERLREILHQVQEEAQQNPNVWRDVQKKFIEFLGYKDKMADALFEDVKILLSPAQMERWPSFERSVRRAHTLDDQQSIVTAARVDLIKLIDDVAEDAAPDVRTQLADLVERYEIELDRLLVRKKEMEREQLARITEVMNEGGDLMNQMGEYQKMFDASRELQLKIRDLNEKFERQFAGRISPELQEEFTRSFNRRAMPTVYGESYADEAFAAALGIESLTDDQRTRIQDLQDEFQREAEAVRTRWAAALRDWQENVQITEMFGAGQGGGAQAEAQRDAKKALDERFYERLRAILTPEQRALLPEREKDWRSSGGFGFGD